MERIEAGMFAVSKAGHDKNELYIIMKAEGEYVYLIDGRLRTLAKPKKKKCKHIQIIRRIPESWNPRQLSDAEVRRFIRQYRQELRSS